MSLEQLELLESRIQEMIGIIRRLKQEKAGLETKIVQKEKEFHQLQQERAKARLRIEKILGTLNHLEQDSDKGK